MKFKQNTLYKAHALKTHNLNQKKKGPWNSDRNYLPKPIIFVQDPSYITANPKITPHSKKGSLHTLPTTCLIKIQRNQGKTTYQGNQIPWKPNSPPKPHKQTSPKTVKKTLRTLETIEITHKSKKNNRTNPYQTTRSISEEKKKLHANRSVSYLKGKENRNR